MSTRIREPSGRSEVIEVPATPECFLTRDFLKDQCNIGELKGIVEPALLDKTYPPCEPCQHRWVEYPGGLEHNIFASIGREKALVPLSRILWHLQQQRDGQDGLLSVSSAKYTRFFIPEIKGYGIVTLRWYEESKCWGMYVEFLDQDETEPLMNTLRFIVQP